MCVASFLSENTVNDRDVVKPFYSRSHVSLKFSNIYGVGDYLHCLLFSQI